jgi:hypothetical protein
MQSGRTTQLRADISTCVNIFRFLGKCNGVLEVFEAVIWEFKQ